MFSTVNAISFSEGDIALLIRERSEFLGGSIV